MRSHARPIAAAGAALDPRILDEAADWLMQRSAAGFDRAAWARWHDTSPEHARAWARAELLTRKLEGLPVSLAMPVLDRPAAVDRRALLARSGKLAIGLAVLPAGWVGWRQATWGGWTADYRAGPGERRELQLADGTRITLDAGTAIDVRFDAAQRLVRLRAGQMLVQTGHGAGDAHRGPFRVATPHGRLEALGTRFTVRQQDDVTQVAVLDGAVRIDPRDAGARDAATSLVLGAGQQSRFTATDVRPPSAVDEIAATAWTRGMLLADGMALADVANELSRYRRGVVQCDPAVADLRVTGSFPVGSSADTDRSLVMLVSTYPVEAQARLQGLWVSLVPRGD